MKNQRTLVILKPDAIQRSLMGEIISRIERTGLKLVAAKFLVATREQCLTHYNKDDAWFLKIGERIIEKMQKNNVEVKKQASEYGKDMLEATIRFVTAGPMLAMVFQGNQSVGIVKKIVGDTEPLSSDVGTIRSDYTIDSYELANLNDRCVRNLIHCSDEVPEAEREIKVWFKDEELINYTHINEKILYDINLDGILD
jgi:nucleoside-diphosphate kinase